MQAFYCKSFISKIIPHQYYKPGKLFLSHRTSIIQKLGTLFATLLSMHPLIISGLSSIGTSLLDQTLNKIRNIEAGTINFHAILQRLSKKGCAVETCNRMKADLLEGIRSNPLFNEFFKDPNTAIAISIDPQGRCSFKENGKLMLTCSRDSNLGKMGIAYFNVAQLSIPSNQQLKEVYLENIA